MPTYVQAAVGDVWHWCRNCPSYPMTYAQSEFHSGKERPRDGGLCDRCQRKERDNDCVFSSSALGGTGSFRT